MNENANSLKETLTSLIREMAAAPAPYVKKPEKVLPERKSGPLKRLCNSLSPWGATAYIRNSWNRRAMT